MAATALTSEQTGAESTIFLGGAQSGQVASDSCGADESGTDAKTGKEQIGQVAKERCGMGHCAGWNRDSSGVE